MPLGVYEVTLVDSYGYGWKCEMKYDAANPSLCGLYNGWGLFRHRKILLRGVHVKISVSPVDPKLILFDFNLPICC